MAQVSHEKYVDRKDGRQKMKSKVGARLLLAFLFQKSLKNIFVRIIMANGVLNKAHRK